LQRQSQGEFVREEEREAEAAAREAEWQRQDRRRTLTPRQANQHAFNNDEDDDEEGDEVDGRDVRDKYMGEEEQQQREMARDGGDQRRMSPMASSRGGGPSRDDGGGAGGGGGVRGHNNEYNDDDVRNPDTNIGRFQENEYGQQQQQQQQQVYEQEQGMYPTIPSPVVRNTQHKPSAPILLPKRDLRKEAQLKKGKLGLMQGNQAYKDLMKPRRSLG
jgi:hypothetical protein